MSVARPFIERGYYVFPILALQVLAHESGVETGNNSVTESSFLKEITGADAVLSVTITEWEYSKIVDPKIRVRAEYGLVDVTTGRNIWQCTVRARVDYMTYAPMGIGKQASYTSAIDARRAADRHTRLAITSPNNELPYGPYYSGGFWFRHF